MKRETIIPKVSLVGAGPGDPDLLTLKAVKVLQTADVVLYDALINDEILKLCPESATKVYVGKRAGRHSLPQQEINQLMVQHAFTSGHVVRLKGGDPFIFGRGYEEMLHIESFGIEVQVVPGISSAIAVPELCRVPLTARGLSESFWVVTGTTRCGVVSDDIQHAARSNATVVILMGMHKLTEIMKIFAQHGKEDTPVAIVQNGSLPQQKIGVGTVSNIVDTVAQQKLGSPAIIIVGAVAGTIAEHVLVQNTQLPWKETHSSRYF